MALCLSHPGQAEIEYEPTGPASKQVLEQDEDDGFGFLNMDINMDLNAIDPWGRALKEFGRLGIIFLLRSCSLGRLLRVPSQVAGHES